MCVQTHDHTNIIDDHASTTDAVNHKLTEVLCPHCDLLVELPVLQSGQKADCPRCHTTLFRYWRNSQRLPFSYAISALLMFVIALLFPFVNFQVSGNFNQVALGDISAEMFNVDYSSLGLCFIIFVHVLPLFCLISIITLCLDIKLPDAIKRRLARSVFLLKPWCMAEIFLVGVAVSFVKLISYGDIGIGASFIPYCLFSVLMIKAFQTIDPYWLWNHIAPAPKIDKPLKIGETGLAQGLRLCTCCQAILPAEEETCPRCYTKGEVRYHRRLQWTIALLLTSIMLYIPANVLPIMITVALGDNISSTILSGVISLWDEGSYPVAIIVFVASILIPSLKMIAIGSLCLYALGKGQRSSKYMHIMYEIVEFVGRWSMLDIFVISVLSALVKMGNLMGVFPEIGAVFFASVVVLTMIASNMYDPRLIWDRETALDTKEVEDVRE